MALGTLLLQGCEACWHAPFRLDSARAGALDRPPSIRGYPSRSVDLDAGAAGKASRPAAVEMETRATAEARQTGTCRTLAGGGGPRTASEARAVEVEAGAGGAWRQRPTFRPIAARAGALDAMFSFSSYRAPGSESNQLTAM